MGSSGLLGIMAMLLILLFPMAAKGDSNTTDSFLDKVCEEVECGKGSCVVNTSYPLNFICECESGWKRTQDEDDKYATSFLPCVIPQCSLNYGCQSAPPPVPEKSFPHNLSAFNPCYWAYCGEGKCAQNRTHTYSCECSPNYFNLLNISFFPCYSECTLGSDCSKLGIKVADSTSGSGNQDSSSSVLRGRFHWMIMLLMLCGAKTERELISLLFISYWGVMTIVCTIIDSRCICFLYNKGSEDI